MKISPKEMLEMVTEKLKEYELEDKNDLNAKVYCNMFYQLLGLVKVTLENYEMQIDLTEADLSDLLEGDDFEWEYDGIKIHLFNQDIMNEEE